MLVLVGAALSLWGLSKMTEKVKRHWNQILKYAIPLSVIAMFACFFIAAYSMQSEQAKELDMANQRIQDLQLGQALATKALAQEHSQPSSPTAPLLTVWINGATVLKKTQNENYDPAHPDYSPEYYFKIFAPSMPIDWNTEDSILAVNYKYYMAHPMKLDSEFAKLSVDNKIIQSAPLFFLSVSQEMFYPQGGTFNGPTALQFWMYFKYKGIVKPGNYSGATISVIAENVTYTSSPFQIYIPTDDELSKQYEQTKAN